MSVNTENIHKNLPVIRSREVLAKKNTSAGCFPSEAEELILKIFEFLNYASLNAASVVCTSWNRILKDGRILKLRTELFRRLLNSAPLTIELANLQDFFSTQERNLIREGMQRFVVRGKKVELNSDIILDLTTPVPTINQLSAKKDLLKLTHVRNKTFIFQSANGQTISICDKATNTDRQYTSEGLQQLFPSLLGKEMQQHWHFKFLGNHSLENNKLFIPTIVTNTLNYDGDYYGALMIDLQNNTPHFIQNPLLAQFSKQGISTKQISLKYTNCLHGIPIIYTTFTQTFPLIKNAISTDFWNKRMRKFRKRFPNGGVNQVRFSSRGIISYVHALHLQTKTEFASRYFYDKEIIGTELINNHLAVVFVSNPYEPNQNKTIKVQLFDRVNLYRKKTIFRISTNYTYIDFKRHNQTLFLRLDSTLYLIDIPSSNNFLTLKELITDCNIAFNQNYLIIPTSNEIQIWDLSKQELVISKKFEATPKQILVKDQQDLIVILQNGKRMKWEL